MVPLKKSLSLALGLVILATIAVLIGTAAVSASPRLNTINAAPPPPSLPVTVVNTPLPVTGAVTGTVAVSSAPPVTFAGPQPVTFRNVVETPVFVDPDGVAAFNSFGGYATNPGPLTNVADSQYNCNFGAGGRAVIDNATIAVRVPIGTIVENAYVGLAPPDGIVFPIAFFAPVKVNSDSVSDYYVATEPFRTFIDSNAPIGVGITANLGPTLATTPFYMQCTFTAHNVPA